MTEQRVATAARRVDAALASTMAHWSADELSEGRRAIIREHWPALAGALDELCLSVTARSAAEVESLSQLQHLAAAATAPQSECEGSDTSYSGPVGVKPGLIQSGQATAPCPACGQVVGVTREGGSWLVRPHTREQ